MNQGIVTFWMSALGTLCWGVCFIWMHRISARQTDLLDEIREQGKRIEKLSKAEHALIKEVHPQVGQIKQELQAVAKAIKDE